MTGGRDCGSNGFSIFVNNGDGTLAAKLHTIVNQGSVTLNASYRTYTRRRPNQTARRMTVPGAV